ncbi:FAD-dependent monooxygenase [Streptoalloteichus hindustanus]|uniref:Tetracenomycin A2 monooxygenase-dioxygenase n=1 Tax=Streptoalloteichus hindustanus TaxID=2017 RepID=A0A1M5I9J4_STRHI|nr:FAD-dependent monooxygenase [Streptoalloteichus hindustanus]SHG24921.1 tetracenomycin A2 monooxygenase-dioxygenase [Streptoalloteichus hindustanus]
MRTRHVPALVVGAGPVGLSTAVFLHHWGVPALVVDKRDPTSAPARANISLRSLEVFRSVGMGPALDEVAWRGGPPMRTVHKDSGLGATQRYGGLPAEYLRRLDTCSPVDAHQHLTQREVQQVALRRLPDEAVCFGLRLLDFSADEDGVRARVVDTATGEEQEITAEYLIGADGARSRTRELLGVTVPDREVLARLHTAFFRADLGNVVSEWGTHLCVVRNDRVYATLFAKNGGDQWSSHIMDYPGKPDELVDLPEEKVVELLRAAIGDDTRPIELHGATTWEAALGIASAFRRGRVFLAGDSAHVQSSAGGLGMNTGIQDGHNLAWKLAAVLRGQAAPSLLDSYETERRSAARDSLALSRRAHRGYQERHGDPRRMDETIAVDYLRAMMFYRYRSTAVLAEDTEDTTDTDDTDGSVLRDQALPGCRFPHHWVDSDRSRVSTLDLIGSKWTVLTGHTGTPWLSAADLVGADLGLTVGAHRLSHHQGDVFSTLTGLAPDGAVLVRPDGFVAWRAPSPGSAPDLALRQALGRVLGRG